MNIGRFTSSKMEEKYGERPFQYVHAPTGRLSNEVYVKTYILVTGDWFEVGGAYSLHSTEEKAKKFKTDGWWVSTQRTRMAFVSDSTLEKITNAGGDILRSWER
jgi:hypothetical protein